MSDPTNVVPWIEVLRIGLPTLGVVVAAYFGTRTSVRTAMRLETQKRDDLEYREREKHQSDAVKMILELSGKLARTFSALFADSCDHETLMSEAQNTIAEIANAKIPLDFDRLSPILDLIQNDINLFRALNHGEIEKASELYKANARFVADVEIMFKLGKL